MILSSVTLAPKLLLAGDADVDSAGAFVEDCADVRPGYATIAGTRSATKTAAAERSTGSKEVIVVSRFFEGRFGHSSGSCRVSGGQRHPGDRGSNCSGRERRWAPSVKRPG